MSAFESELAPSELTFRDPCRCTPFVVLVVTLVHRYGNQR